MKVCILLTILILFTACSPKKLTHSIVNKSILNSGILNYSKSNKKLVSITSTKNSNYKEVHQYNGISILGNFIDGKPNGRVEIIYADDKLTSYKHKVVFNNGVMNSYISIYYQDGIIVNTNAKLELNASGSYIRSIKIYGISDILLPSGEKYKVEVKKNKIVKVFSQNNVDAICSTNQIKINKGLVYNLCINKNTYSHHLSSALSFIKKRLRNEKGRTKYFQRNKAIKSEKFLKKWRSTLKSVEPVVKNFYKTFYEYENQYIGRIHTFYPDTNSIKYSKYEFLKSWVYANPPSIYKNISILNNEKFGNLELDKDDALLRTASIFSKIISEFTLDNKIMQDELIDSIFSKGDVFLVPNYNGSPISDMLGNLYLPKNNNYSEEELYLIMLHEAIHIASYSNLRKFLAKNINRYFVKRTSLLVPKDKRNNEFDSSVKSIQNFMNKILKDDETENDIILLSIIKDNFKLSKIFLELLTKSSFHKSLNRKKLISHLSTYYHNGGSKKNLIKNLVLLKIFLQYSPPKYIKEIIPIDNKSNNSIIVETIDSTYNINGLNKLDHIEGFNLFKNLYGISKVEDYFFLKSLYANGANKDLLMALEEHGYGAYFKINLSIVIDGSIK